MNNDLDRILGKISTKIRVTWTNRELLFVRLFE